MPTFNDAAEAAGRPGATASARSASSTGRASSDIGLDPPDPPLPVRAEPARRSSTRTATRRSTSRSRGCAAASSRPAATHMVIGVSGGLDSTHALIVAAKVCDRLGLPRTTILGFTMPGFAHRRGHQVQRLEADDARSASPPRRSTSARPRGRCSRTSAIPFAARRAGLRRRPSRTCRRACAPTTCSASPTSARGFVIGTGDLSELALGWCTYGVGDQMSHYASTPGVPKTLIQYLIRWAIAHRPVRRRRPTRCSRRSSATEISPELVPADADGAIQSTEAKIGPYELHDFFLYHIMRYGQPPSKVAFLAWHAWRDAERGPGRSASPRRRGGSTTSRRSASGSRASSGASSPSASSSARRCRTGPRSRPAARCRRAATGARRPTRSPRPWLDELRRSLPR